MSRKLARTGQSRQSGFSMVELMVVIALTAVVVTTFYTFFKTNFSSYLGLQEDASNFTELASKSQRVASVVRGLTGINTASANQLTIYAYFYPTDTYVSLVDYYLSADNKTLLADVTQMTSNPPIGTPIANSKKTYTIMSNFQQTASKTLFEYTDSAGSTLTPPISDLNLIKAVKINLGVATTKPGINQAMELDVSLRNRQASL